MAARRTGEKAPMKLEDIAARVAGTLQEIQIVLFHAARERREAHSIRGVTKARFIEFMKQPGGFAYGGVFGGLEGGGEIKRGTGATIPGLPAPPVRAPH